MNKGYLTCIFIYVNPKYSELIDYVDGKLSYFYWYDKADKTVISKALTKKINKIFKTKQKKIKIYKKEYFHYKIQNSN